MRSVLLRASALALLVFIPGILVAAPSDILIYCGNLPGCGPGFDEHFSSVLILLLTRVPNYVYIVGVLFIMIGGGYMIFSLGEADRVTKGKTTILWALIGILTMQYAQIFINDVLIPEVLTRNGGSDLIAAATNTLVGTIFDLLQVVMLGVAVYSGMKMVVSFGKEDEFKKARDGLIWAAIGAIVINLAGLLAHSFCVINPAICFAS